MSKNVIARLAAIAALLAASQWLVACSEETPAAPAASTPEQIATAEPLATHVVERGDRLVDIAAEYDIPLARLLKWNDIPNPDVIEVGDVISLEDPALAAERASATTPAPQATALPRLVQIEEVEESFTERVQAWWDDAPKPSLSDDAIGQGIIAAVTLPLGVVALLLLWTGARYGVRGTRTALNAARSSAAAEVDEVFDTEDASSNGAALETSTRGRVGRWLRAGGAQLTRLASSAGRGVHRLGRTIGTASVWLGQRAWQTAVAAVKATGRGVAASASWTASLLHIGARRAADAHQARRDRLRSEEVRRESRRWWSQGRERLRIGLLDEAEKAFETGLQLSVEGGWQEEIALYREELKLLGERRSVERALVPSGSDS